MKSEPTPGTVPLHHSIADALRRQIEAGELRPGDSLPSVRELEEQWETSANTVRAALSVLREEGRINAGRGKPATVRESIERQRINLTSKWADEQKQLVLQSRAEREVRGAIEMISGIAIKDIDSFHDYEVVPASDELAQEFDVEPGTPLQQRTYEMRRRPSGTRLSFSVSYIPLALIEGYPPLLDDDEEPWPGGHQHQLYTVDIEVDAFRRTITAVQPTPAERQRWGIGQGVPMIRVRSRSVDVKGRVVELSDAVYPADRTEIEVVEQLTRWPDDYPRFDRTRGDA